MLVERRGTYATRDAFQMTQYNLVKAALKTTVRSGQKMAKQVLVTTTG
jgi:hypothetical protein